MGFQPMRVALKSRKPFVLLLIMSALSCASIARARPTTVPVIVELFSSEGCSSCPPADAQLKKFIDDQPVADALIIPLVWQVDYWNRLGWTDPYSSPDATARQRAYQKSFGNDTVYTPQVVVDGTREFVGGEARAMQNAATLSRNSDHAAINLACDSDGDNLKIKATIRGVPAAAMETPIDVIAAITEDNLTSHIPRGENAGRTLTHAAIVRTSKILGTLQFRDCLQEGEIKLSKDWSRQNLHLVVWLQAQQAGRIWAAGTIAVAPKAN